MTVSQFVIDKILKEVAPDRADPVDLLVDAEVRRIRSAILPSDGDKEDLITYARSVVELRIADAMRVQAVLDELI